MKTTLNVEGMHCEHCVAAVSEAVCEVPGVGKVDVNLTGKTVTFDHEEDVSVAAVRDAILEQGYDVK